jgi:hypothetical protein
MIQYDLKAGTHFIGRKITVSAHAVDQAIEDFRVNRFEAERWVIDNLVKSQFIGTMYGENDRPVRLFGYKRIAFVLAVEHDVVITVYQRDKVDPALRNPIEQIVKTTVRTATDRLHAAEVTHRRTIDLLERLLPNVDDEEGAQIRAEIERHAKSLRDARQEHARIMKGVVAYV